MSEIKNLYSRTSWQIVHEAFLSKMYLDYGYSFYTEGRSELI